MRVLLTGGSGFIGRNILPILGERHIVFAPKRNELDLMNHAAVRDYLVEHAIDIIVHSATPNPSKNLLDRNEAMMADMMRMFLSLYINRHLVRKFIYLGSGAMYDKAKDIVLVNEDKAFEACPKDDYGLAKNLMFRLTGDNVYNLCIFGCYGPGDAPEKFITHCIRCCIRGEAITMRQECRFDFVHVFDVGNVLNWMISSEPKYHCYNLTTGSPLFLSEIAGEISRQMNDAKVVVLNSGLNREYTASNARLRSEYTKPFIDLSRGVEMQIEWEKKNWGIL